MKLQLIHPTSPPSAEWPTLVPLDAPDLPALDVGLIPGWAGDYARALALATETPPELAAAMVLACCSAAAAPRVRVEVTPGYYELVNLWLVAALPSGTRKSAVHTAATAPLVDWEWDHTPVISSDGDKGRDDDAPASPRLGTSDATPERLGTLLAEQGECMAWLSSEGGIFDLLEGRYGRVPNLDLVLKAHAGDPERVDRRSRPPVHLHRPRLTIGLSPQPDLLRGLAGKPGFRGRGLLARFLFLLPRSPLGYRTFAASQVPEAIRGAYVDGVRAMLDWEPAVDARGAVALHTLRLSPEAYEEWLSFARYMETQMRPGGDWEHFSDWGGKAPGAAARIAGVLHGIKHAHGRPWDAVITAETMGLALEILAVIGRHSLATLDMMGADPTIAAARLVWMWIQRGKRRHFTVRECYNALRASFPRVDHLRVALDALEERGYVRDELVGKPDGPGRPRSPMIHVRPELWG